MKKYKWYKIAASKAALMIEEKAIVSIEVGGKKMCLAKYNNDLFACAGKCPHAGGLMNEGWIDATGNIVCPIHRYKFSLDKGRNVTGEGYYLKTYPIEERVDGIYVGIESGRLFGW